MPIITDGEQRKYHNFWTYSVHGLPNTAPDGFKSPFSAGHVRRMPRLTAGPFRYKVYADRYLDVAKRYAHMALKQAVISPSALSLMYPAEDIAGYSRQELTICYAGTKWRFAAVSTKPRKKCTSYVPRLSNSRADTRQTCPTPPSTLISTPVM